MKNLRPLAHRRCKWTIFTGFYITAILRIYLDRHNKAFVNNAFPPEICELDPAVALP